MGYKGWESVDWINVTQDRNQWQAFGHGNECTSPIKGRKFLD
jgi:hypothetical protein